MSTSASASRRRVVMISSAWLGSATPLGWLCELCAPDCSVALADPGGNFLANLAERGHITNGVRGKVDASRGTVGWLCERCAGPGSATNGVPEPAARHQRSLSHSSSEASFCHSAGREPPVSELCGAHNFIASVFMRIVISA